jgi:hypothetical protein
VIGTSLIASDRQAILSKITGLAAIISAPLCVLFVLVSQALWHNGAVGAAIGDVLLECFLLVSYVRASVEPPLDRASAGVFLRAIVAALPMAGLLMATRATTNKATIVLAGAVGAVAYVPLCAVMRCWDPQDVNMIREMISQRMKK